MSNRREFLQTTAAFAGAFLLPHSLPAATAPNFYFIHSGKLNHWSIVDPVLWSLENAHEPILERAAEGLSKLTASDGGRIVRLVVRRCGLNLLEVGGNQVQVQFWGQQGQANLRPFFKTHGLARPEIGVILHDRKKETFTFTTGDSFLYGVGLASNFDLRTFQNKWEARFKREADDWMAAPCTNCQGAP